MRKACPGYRIACLTVRAQPMFLFFLPLCGFTSTTQLLVNPVAAFPHPDTPTPPLPSEADDYREYLSVFVVVVFFASAPSHHPNVHQREYRAGGVEGRGGHTSGGWWWGGGGLHLINVVETYCQHVKDDFFSREEEK